MTGAPILQTCFSLSWGGLEIQALEVTDQLRARGHDVRLACPRDSRLGVEARLRGLRCLELKVKGYVHPLVVWQLSHFIRHHGIRIIHSQLSKDLSTVVPAADLSGVSPRILLSKRVGSYLSKKDIAHRYTYSRVSRVLAISDVIHRNVLETTPMAPERVLTLHDAIDVGSFMPQRGNRERVRKEFGFEEHHVVVGFVGRFSRGKGHEELLRSAAEIAVTRPDVRFLIAGEASAGEQAYADGIHRLAASLDSRGIVTFAGFRRDITDLMASFDIFAFPSHAESFGVVLIEAMAMERPVVSTNCDGVLDIVVDGETGLYVNPGNVPELAAALTRLVDDPGLRLRLGKAGRERVVRLFERQSQVDRLEAIYAEVLEEKPL